MKGRWGKLGTGPISGDARAMSALMPLIAPRADGAPSHAAIEGTLYWDITSDTLYGNADGDTTWQLIGGGGLIAAHTLLNDAWHTDTVTQTVTRGSLVYGNATPKWDELAHPAAAGYALTTDATDVAWDQTPTWTGSHTFDDGAGNSPAISFVGGSNNDTVLLYLLNDAVAGDSDFVIRLAGGDADSCVLIQNSADATVLQFDANGGITFLGASGSNIVTVPDNVVDAVHITDAGDGDVYMRIITTTNSEVVIFNDGGNDVDFQVEAVGVADALEIQGADGQITLGVLGAGVVQSTAGGVLSSAAVPLSDIAGYAEGSMIIGGAADWEALAEPGGAGYILISDGTTFAWDQTPTLTGLLTLAAGLTFSGASAANNITIPDNVAIAVELLDAGGLEYLRIVTTNAQPIINFNSAAADVDFHVEASGVADAFRILGVNGQITLGALGAGFVQSTAGGVLSSTAIVAGDLPAHTHAGAGQGGTITHAVTTGQATDDHHAEVHVVNSTGPHAEAGLTIGHVLRVSGAAAFSFAALIAADLPVHGSTHDVGAGDPVTTTSDGAANHSRILASSAAGAITMDDYFTVNGGTFGIAGNELLTVNAAGTFAFSGISGVSVENGDWIGAGVGTAWLYDSGNGDITTAANVGIGTSAPDQLLEIEGTNARIHLDGSNAQIFVDRNATTSRSEIIYQTAAVSKWFVGIADSDLLGDGSEFFIGTVSGGTSAAIVIETNGNVGIGTSLVLGQLHVNQGSVTGAQPVLFLDQGHAVHPCIRFSGDATDQDIILWDINVTGTPTLTWDEGADSMIYSVDTAVTNTTIDLLTLTHTTSGGAADRFGSGLLFRLESDGSAVDTMRISTVWEDATGNENAEFQLLLNYNGSLIEAGIIVGPGTVPTSAIANTRGDGAVDFQVFRGAATHIASGNFSALVAGRNSTASGIYSGVFAGDGNEASSTHAIVIGGFSNLSSGQYALTGGYDAHATHDNAMVFSATAAQTLSWADDTFTVRCIGGSRYYTGAGVGTGVELAAGDDSWASLSDRNAKRIVQVIGPEILDIVAELPVYEYSLKSQNENIKHIGPVAQEFNPLFGFQDRMYIHNMDAIGITLAAAKELVLENRELRSRIRKLEDQWLH